MNNVTALIETFPKKVRMGTVDGRAIYLSRPSFDCGWYWSFGYLGNSQCHYHMNHLDAVDYQNKGIQRKNMFDQLKLHFGTSLVITNDKDLWAFVEIARTIYSLKETAEVFGRGGSHYTTNPDAALIKDTALVTRINTVLIPQQIASLYAILAKYI